MKCRPILFNGPMVRAILAGTKTQTRRIVKPDAWIEDADYGMDSQPVNTCERIDLRRCPYGQPGDRLWLREKWRVWEKPGICGDADVYRHKIDHPTNDYAIRQWREGVEYFASSDCDPSDHDGWRPSIHMPRWASRITLEIVSVRCEQLRSISENDATAEGVTLGAFSGGDNRDATRAFIALWQSINGPGSWEANPWVWAVEFKRIDTTQPEAFPS